MRYKYWKSTGQFLDEKGEPRYGWFYITGEDSDKYHVIYVEFFDMGTYSMSISKNSIVAKEWETKTPPSDIQKKFDDFKVGQL